MEGKLERNHWHPGFVGAMELEFKEYIPDRLTLDDEHHLSLEPLSMDLLILKKSKDVVVTDEIGQIFREHNVIEYKSPTDKLNIDVYIKTVGYAYLYKGLSKKVDAIPLSELTATMMRDVVPDALFERIKAEGGTVEQRYPGIYYISGVVRIPTQVIVTSKLDKAKHPSLRLLTKNATEEDVERFIAMAKELTEPGDRDHADAVLQVSITANPAVFENVKRRNPEMCEALKELMKDEIQEEVDKSLLKSIKNLMETLKLTAVQAMDALKIPSSDQGKYLAML